MIKDKYDQDCMSVRWIHTVGELKLVWKVVWRAKIIKLYTQTKQWSFKACKRIKAYRMHHTEQKLENISLEQLYASWFWEFYMTTDSACGSLSRRQWFLSLCFFQLLFFQNIYSLLPNSLIIDIICRIQRTWFTYMKVRHVAKFLLSISWVKGEHRTSDHSIHWTVATFQTYSRQ